jgi:trigger factor
MSDKLKKVAPGKVEITVAASKDEWQKAKDKAFNKLAAKVTVKGFRPGKAPKAELAKGVNPDQLNNEAINNILPVLYSKALEEEKVTPFLQPNVEITKFSSDDFEAKFTIVIAPSVKLGAYKDLHAEKEAPSVSDKEVEDAVNSQLQGAATLEVVDREAKMGDTVTFDFEGFVDGKPFDGGKAENYSLELGSHSFVPGFEEGLVGVKSGDSKDVEITFPENYVKELASKKAVFKCKVHEIKEKKVPELNDEAVKDLAIPGVETVDQLKEKTKTDLLTNKVNAAQRAYVDAIVSKIVETSEIDLADEIVDQEAATQEANLKKRIEAQGLTFEQYLEITGTKVEDLKKQFHDESAKNIKSFLVVSTIGAQEKLDATDADVDAEIAKMAESYKMKPEDIKKAIEPQLNQLRDNLRTKKIEDFLLANNH